MRPQIGRMRIRLACIVIGFALLPASGSYGEEPGKDEFPHAEGYLLRTTGPVRVRLTAFQLWQHGYLTGSGDIKIWEGLDPARRRAPGSMIEVWETAPDLTGKHILRLRTAYKWQISPSGGRCHDLVWLEHPKQLWLFTCESLRKQVEIKAYLVDLNKAIESDGKMGAAGHWPRAKWPEPAPATAVHTWTLERERDYDHMAAVVDGTSKIMLALRSRSGRVQWVSYDPLVRKPEDRWRVGVELW